jgi:hypothetical protein
MSGKNPSDKENGDAPPEDAMQDMIGNQLRNLYDSVLVEPIPDRIVDLLMKLDELPSTDQATDAERNAADTASRSEPDNDNHTERK